MAQNDPSGIVPFAQFLDNLQAAPPEHMAAMANSMVAHEDASRQMHSYLLQHYEGVEAVHSFRDENGSVFDCVPIERQPGLRGGEAAASAPELPDQGPAPAAAAM